MKIYIVYKYYTTTIRLLEIDEVTGLVHIYDEPYERWSTSTRTIRNLKLQIEEDHKKKHIIDTFEAESREEAVNMYKLLY